MEDDGKNPPYDPWMEGPISELSDGSINKSRRVCIASRVKVREFIKDAPRADSPLQSYEFSDDYSDEEEYIPWGDPRAYFPIPL